MKKILLFSIAIIFLTAALTTIVLAYYGIGPSFEIASQSEPEITNIIINPVVDFVIVTATITDPSGISLAGLKIKDDQENEVGTIDMHNDGNYPDLFIDDTFSGLIQTGDYIMGFYSIDIYAKDFFGSEAYIEKIGVINKGIICPIDNDVMLCAEILQQEEEDMENCIIDNDVVVCVTVPSPEIPGLNNCIIDNDVVVCVTVPSPEIFNEQNCFGDNNIIICPTILEESD